MCKYSQDMTDPARVGCEVLALGILGAVLSDEDIKINKVCFSINPESIWVPNLTEVLFLVSFHRRGRGKVQLTHKA